MNPYKNKKTWKSVAALALGAVSLGFGAAALNGVQASANDPIQNFFAVTVGETTTECQTLGDALNIANEAGEAKITLLGDADASGNTWFDAKLTIDLNGYTLSNANLCLNELNGSQEGDSLTYEDSSEAGTGRVLAKQGSVFCTIYAGSLTINGGNFGSAECPYTTVSIGSYGNDQIKVTVNGGTFEILELKATSGDTGYGTFTVNDATVKEASFKDFDDNITVNGGTYRDIEYKNATRGSGGFEEALGAGRTVLDKDGKSINSNGVSYKSLQKIQDRTYDSNLGWIYNNVYSVEEHTCKFDSRSYDETAHWVSCSCGVSEEGVEKISHGEQTLFDKNSHWVGCECGYKSEETPHEATQQKDASGHWYTCDCGYSSDKVKHGGGEATCTEKAVCSVCGEAYGEEPAGHDYEIEADATRHWEICRDCEEKTAKEAHKGGTATESELAICEVCGEEYGDFSTNAPEASGGGNAPTKNEKGCNSSVGGGFAMTGLALAAVAVLRKRKEK